MQAQQFWGLWVVHFYSMVKMTCKYIAVNASLKTRCGMVFWSWRMILVFMECLFNNANYH